MGSSKIDFLQFFDLGAINGEAWLIWLLYWQISGFFIKATKKAESISSRLTHLIPVWIGACLLFQGRHHFFPFERLYDSDPINATGDLFTFIGLAFSIWARVHLGQYWSGIITIKEGHRLIDTGPYQLVRHPIYTGLTLAVIGSAMHVATAAGFVGVVLIVGAFIVKARREERGLIAELKDEYLEYRWRVPFLVPYRLWMSVRNQMRQDAGGQAIASPAFAAASLRSERFRIAGIVAILGFLCVASIVRSAINPLHGDYGRLGAYMSLLLLAACFEGLMFWLAQRAERADRGMGTIVWAIATLIECSFPSLVLLAITADKTYVGPYRSLVSSPVLIYFLFIVLSTMRLNEWLCVWTGFVCAVEYLGLYFFTLHAAPHNSRRDDILPSTFWFFGLYIFFAGLLAAGVTRRIRRHVVAALSEAEMRRKLDRVEYDLNTARSIQMGLLPRSSPKIDGYDIAGFCQPADQTGGDFYDWIELPDDRALFIIADASGHGIGPALLIAACRSYFRAIAMRDISLPEIMRHVDGLLTPDTPDGRFITAAIALLNTKINSMQIYSAAHGPMFLYRAAEEKTELLDTDQPPLGMGLCDGEMATAREYALAPGDALVLVTDGIFESANQAGEQWGLDRLSKFIAGIRTMDSSSLLGEMRQAVQGFSGGTSQADDLTAVVVKRNA